MKHGLMTLLAVCATLCAVAQTNRVYINDFEISPGSTLEVPVMLGNQDSTRGVQFRLTLPKGLQCVEVNLSQYAERKGFVLNNTLKDGSNRMMVYHVGQAFFPPGDKAVVEMTLQADETFSGGKVSVWKCRGETMTNQTIYIDDSTTTVSVPMAAQGGSFLDTAPVGN